MPKITILIDGEPKFDSGTEFASNFAAFLTMRRRFFVQ